MPGKSRATANSPLDAGYHCVRRVQQVLKGCQRSLCQTATRANRHRRRNPRGVVPLLQRNLRCKVSIKHVVLSRLPVSGLPNILFSSLFQRGSHPVQYFKKVSYYIRLVSKAKVILCYYFAPHTFDTRWRCTSQISDSPYLELLAKQIISPVHLISNSSILCSSIISGK